MAVIRFPYGSDYDTSPLRKPNEGLTGWFVSAQIFRCSHHVGSGGLAQFDGRGDHGAWGEW